MRTKLGDQQYSLQVYSGEQPSKRFCMFAVWVVGGMSVFFPYSAPYRIVRGITHVVYVRPTTHRPYLRTATAGYYRIIVLSTFISPSQLTEM